MLNNITAGGYTSIQQAAGAVSKTKGQCPLNTEASALSFEDILKNRRSIEEIADSTKAEELKFSKHADARLRQREISLTDEQMKRLTEGTRKAGMKGINETLVLLDDMAFIVNTKNKTVVTAMDQNMNEENIFTNIDGAVII